MLPRRQELRFKSPKIARHPCKRDPINGSLLRRRALTLLEIQGISSGLGFRTEGGSRTRIPKWPVNCNSLFSPGARTALVKGRSSQGVQGSQTQQRQYLARAFWPELGRLSSRGCRASCVDSCPQDLCKCILPSCCCSALPTVNRQHLSQPSASRGLGQHGHCSAHIPMYSASWYNSSTSPMRS